MGDDGGSIGQSRSKPLVSFLSVGLIVLANAIFAQENTKTPLDTTAAAIDSSSKSVMLIDPKARAADYAQAFDLLRKNQPTQKIIIRTQSSVLMNVIDVTPSTGGTLLLVKTLSAQGNRTQIVPVEQITEIGYSL